MVPNLRACRWPPDRAYHGPVPMGRPLPAAASGRLGRRALILLAACHPEPAALVTILTVLLAVAAGGRPPTILWLAAAVAAGQVGVGWSNDYLDRAFDRAAGRTDKPLAARGDSAPRLSPAAVRAAALVALVAAVPLSLATSAGFAAAHLAAVGCALAYNAGLKARPVSVLPYAVAFALLPVAVGFALPAPRWVAAWAVAASALAGAGGHFTQALPDIPADRRLGVRGLPQVIGQRGSAGAAAALLLAANGTIALAVERPALALVHGMLAVALAAGIVAAALCDRPRLAFRLTLGSAALAVLAFLASGGAL